MKTFFKYFLPWCFFKVAKGIANLHKLYVELFREEPFIAMMISVMVGAGLVMLTMMSVLLYVSTGSDTPEAQAQIILSNAFCIILASVILHPIVIGVVVTFEKFQKEQQDFLDKLSEKYDNEH